MNLKEIDKWNPQSTIYICELKNCKLSICNIPLQSQIITQIDIGIGFVIYEPKLKQPSLHTYKPSLPTYVSHLNIRVCYIFDEADQIKTYFMYVA